MLKNYLLVFFLLIVVVSSAQTHDSLLKQSPVKTITTRQYNALMKGEDLYNMSLAADMNGLYGPGDVLKYKKELDLSPVQVAALGKINTELQRKKTEMGGFIVTNEKKLDGMFGSKKLNEGDIIFFGNRYGLYLGELRVVILLAAYNTYKLLSPQQISRLRQVKNVN